MEKFKDFMLKYSDYIFYSIFIIILFVSVIYILYSIFFYSSVRINTPYEIKQEEKRRKINLENKLKMNCIAASAKIVRCENDEVICYIISSSKISCMKK